MPIFSSFTAFLAIQARYNLSRSADTLFVARSGLSLSLMQSGQVFKQARPPFTAGLPDMNRYFSCMHGHCRSCFQDLLTDFADAPAFLCDAFHQRPQAVHHLVSIETQQQTDLIAAHHLLYGRGATAGRR